MLYKEWVEYGEGGDTGIEDDRVYVVGVVAAWGGGGESGFGELFELERQVELVDSIDNCCLFAHGSQFLYPRLHQAQPPRKTGRSRHEAGTPCLAQILDVEGSGAGVDNDS